jgi:hypothetical protein
VRGEAVQHPVHDDEHRHLQQQREARGHRVDLVLLVQLHHLFVELLSIAAVLLLQLAHLGLQLLHLEHALGALQHERGSDDHHDHGDHRDGDDVVVREAVEPGQQRCGRLEEAGDHEVIFFPSGTGSYPDGPNGRQRTRRRPSTTAPAPCRGR